MALDVFLNEVCGLACPCNGGGSGTCNTLSRYDMYPCNRYDMIHIDRADHVILVLLFLASPFFHSKAVGVLCRDALK